MKHIRHTPWKANEDRSDILYSHTIVDSDGRRLARLMQHDSVFIPKEVSSQEEAAIAKLMASAPELLTKLEACVLFLEQERKKIDRAIQDIHEFIESVQGEFAGEEIELPLLKVKPEAILARVAFIESMKKKPEASED